MGDICRSLTTRPTGSRPSTESAAAPLSTAYTGYSLPLKVSRRTSRRFASSSTIRTPGLAMGALRVLAGRASMVCRGAKLGAVDIHRYGPRRRNRQREDRAALPAVAQHLSIVSLGHGADHRETEAGALRAGRVEGFE